MDNTEEILKRFDLVLAKLGVTSEFVFETLTRRVFWNGVLWIVADILIFIAATIAIKAIKKKIGTLNAAIDNYNKTAKENEIDNWTALAIADGVFGLFFSLVFTLTGLADVLNPQGPALEKMLGLLR